MTIGTISSAPILTPAAIIIVKERSTLDPVPPIPNIYNFDIVFLFYEWSTCNICTPPFDDTRYYKECNDRKKHIGYSETNTI